MNIFLISNAVIVQVCLQDEYRWIWKAKWSAVKILYLLTRRLQFLFNHSISLPLIFDRF